MASEKVQPESMALANNHLAVHLHRLFAEGKGNAFFSPFSISTAMAMLLCGSENETEIEMRRVLGYDHAGIATQDIAALIKGHTLALLDHQGSYTLSSANSVLTQEGFQVKKDYKSILSDSFQASLLEVDFENNTKNVVKQINDWVNEKTNKMIPKLLQSLDPNTVLVLLNAVYFKGSWLRKFYENSTSPQEFFNYGDEKQVKLVDMMRRKENFPFIEKDSFKALQLSYVGENIAMLILLPRSINGLKALEATLTPSFVHDLSKSMRTKNVKVSLPRFKLEYSTSLVPSFQNLGVRRLFKYGAELGGISDSEKLFVSNIVHKAVLEVNEEGSEAAAATAVTVTLAKCVIKRVPVPVFTVDHPFAFVIYEKKNNMILFMGRVEEL